jgi:uncharacterized protein YeaO (DUF488 family)
MRSDIQVKRVYEVSFQNDGARFLVDRVWPRGIKKEAADLTAWLREVAPSTALRKWFGHDPEKWPEFQRRYTAELAKNAEAWAPLLDAARRGKITLLFGARDTEHNNAVALKNFLENRLKAGRSQRHRATAQ